MDERLFWWLTDYAGMLEFSLLINGNASENPEIEAAVRKNVKDVREYLKQWRVTPPDSATPEPK